MKTFRILLAATLLALPGVITAQTRQADNEKEEVRSYPYAFVGVKGGIAATLNGYNFGDVISPVGAVHGGAWFSPSLGARLMLNAGQAKVGIKHFGTYDYHFGTIGLDAMINLTNAFSRTDDNLFNVILLGGVGANKAWGDNYIGLKDAAGRSYYYNDAPGSAVTELGSKVHNHVALQTRVGLLLDFNVASHWSINLEGDFNHIGSRGYAHRFNGAKGWQFVGMLGVTYKFGGKARKPAPEPVVVPPAPRPEPQPEAQPEVEPDPKPVEQPLVKVLDRMKQEIFYIIARSTPEGVEADKVAEVAEWLKAHPTAVATIKGYADKGTGNPRINEKYARQRAEKVAAALVDRYGISRDRLQVSSYGDTVQPFAENDRNRVVVVVAEEK